MRYIVLSIFVILAVSCSQADGDRTAVEYMPDMMDQVSVKAQEEIMNTPVEGTRPRGANSYPYNVDQGDLAGTYLKNPLEFNRENLMLGQNAYDTYCIVCHGPSGKGNGTIVPKFPMPPTLHSEKVNNWSDGRLFHVMTVGQNLMPAYSDQVTVEQRWAIAYYIRVLQRSVNPTDSDIEEFENWLKEK
jgi:cytochrome c553